MAASGKRGPKKPRNAEKYASLVFEEGRKSRGVIVSILSPPLGTVTVREERRATPTKVPPSPLQSFETDSLTFGLFGEGPLRSVPLFVVAAQSEIISTGLWWPPREEDENALPD